ncbi:bifunctional DNA-formamidopyrimidine glycosylase/DNA-(apurinic or apyrimidinic site) lyase [Candidatus Leptofilum sp.]|uniref:bifunctional DNA-formamidopyrimidine glycosylase/DNA-(apurinic or apyrimidinic site) lyase n=1 Tax=Candidatus Leptofilum sp. TaxID=3241576 RepID=UPI003B5A0F90
MPELPEVETVVQALRQPLIGRTITRVRNDWPRHVGTPGLDALRARIQGCTVQAINRRAKYLVFSLTNGETLIAHLKMSGHLAVVDASQPADKHVHTVFELDNGRELRFRDIRKFGRVYLVQDQAEILGKLGPEPLEPTFTPQLLTERLNGRTRILKPLLLDQQFIAGVGNIYADESLFYAKLHPTRRADSLSKNEIVALHNAIQKVLKMGIEREGASIELYVKPDGSKGDMQNAVAVFRRTGEPCYECGRPIERTVLGGRSTHFCSNCQK